MDSIWFQIILISLLILANAFFACSEIAIVSSRRSRIKHLMEQGDARAKIVNELQSEPEKFLATVQVGITVVGILAGAVGGAAAIEALKPLIQRIPVGLIRESSEAIAITIVVATISYLSIVFGELIPKSLALRFSEPIALFMGPPLRYLLRIFSVVVRVLTESTRIVLKPFGDMPPPEGTFVTEDEIKIFLKEGRERGIFRKSEQELIHSVFEFASTDVKEIMVPRPMIKAISIDTSFDEALDYVIDCGFTRFPVYEGTIDNIKGVLYEKDLLEVKVHQKKISIHELIRPVYFVPESKKIDTLLKELQKKRMHMAIVINEYGNVEGLVTIEDIIEELVGEIEDEHDFEDSPVKIQKDGSMIIDASLPIRDLKERYHLDFQESDEYETLAGLVLFLVQKMPSGGEIVQYGKYKLTIVDMEGKRISKVKLEK